MLSIKGVKSHNIPILEFEAFIESADAKIWNNFNSKDNNSFYKLTTWLHIMQNWYFFFSDNNIKELLHEKIEKYNCKKGFNLK